MAAGVLDNFHCYVADKYYLPNNNLKSNSAMEQSLKSLKSIIMSMQFDIYMFKLFNLDKFLFL